MLVTISSTSLFSAGIAVGSVIFQSSAPLLREMTIFPSGLASVTCLRYPDGGLADVKEEWVVRDIVRWLRRVRPDVAIIWGPDGGYGHPDHIAAGERALTAIELAGVQRHEPELGPHWHAKRCYRFVAGAELVDRLSSLMPAFAEYIETLEVKPQRWTRDRLGAVVDVVDVLDAKVHAMEAHQTQAPDLAMWAAARAKLPEIFREETFIREYPEPGGPPLETDLFAALRAQQPAEMTRALRHVVRRREHGKHPK